ncbi:MAG: diaminopimelate epimerase [Desulfobacterales bacterium]|nr:diaminopimelate epimerase [Desulfobacterales bacterium]
MQFFKYHALGNDYIVLDPEDGWSFLEPEQVRRICHRNYGIGSDGILLGPFEDPDCDFGLRIFNPDGSEAEKSGNGLRIFSRFLHDKGRVGNVPFTVMTAGGPVTCSIHAGSSQVTVDMGTVSFHSEAIPVAGPSREVLDEAMEIQGETFLFCAATVGNPHCVIPRMRISKAETCRLGPLIETGARFPRRTNVQFMQVLNRESIAIEIWERGAGYTLASGSSSTAAAAVAYRLGLCDANILVRMPGGTIEISLTEDFNATMTGPVTPVGSGNLHREMFAWPMPV